MALTKVSTPAIKDEAITLAKLLHGDSNSNGKFLRANNGADPTFETIDLTALSASNLTSGTIPDARFPATLPAVNGANLTGINTDLVSDTSPQLGGDLETNGNHILVGDSSSSADDRIKIGADGDLQLYHDGNNSIIGEFGTGQLNISSQGSGVNIYDTQYSTYSAKFSRLGQELNYEGNKKLETESNGASVTGRLRVKDSGNVDLAITDTSSNAVAAYIGVKTAGYVEYNCYKSGVGTKYPHVFYGYTEEYARIDSAGIKFNGDTATANALDDYETGTCSNIGITSAASSHVQKDSGTVYYTKIGRVVHLYGKFNASNLSTHFGGTHIQITGFPFTTSSYGNSSDILVGIWGGSFNWWNAGYPSISMENSTTTHGLYSHRTPSGTGLGNYSGPDGNTCGNGTHQFNFDLIYFTDA